RYRADEAWPQIPRHIQLSYEFGYLLGIYAAEGSLETRKGEITGGMSFSLNLAEAALADEITDILSRFGVKTQRYYRSEHSLLEVKACNIPLAYTLRALVGCGAREKRVPEHVLSGPLQVRRGFLEGLLDGDG